MKILAATPIQSELAELVPVTAEQPCSTEPESGPIGLRLTPANLAELGSDAPQSAAASVAVESPAIRLQPRPGTKQALVLTLLCREQDAALEEPIGQQAGWRTRRVPR